MFTTFTVCDWIAFPFTVTSNDVGVVAFGFSADDTFVHSGLYFGTIVHLVPVAFPSASVSVYSIVVVLVLSSFKCVMSE